MFGSTKDVTRQKAPEHATRKDFQKIFSEEMAGLHLLAFLLTLDERRANQCFVAGLEDCVRGNTVFKQWARSWSKRTIIKNAIKVISPWPQQPGLLSDAGCRPSNIQAISRSADATPNPLIEAVTRLEALDRFVLVMSVLEGYSVRECSILLDCPTRRVVAARSRALEHLGSATVGGNNDGQTKTTVSWASFRGPTQVA
jgi:hypothetical protein